MPIDWSSLIPGASPLQSGGVNPDQWLANRGKDTEGVPYQAKPGITRKTLAATSALPYATGVSRPPDDGNVRSISSPQPADNASNPPAEAPSGGAVPSTVSPGGGSRFSPAAQMLGSKRRILDQAGALPAAPDVAGISAQKTAAVSAAPDPTEPQYKPTLRSRFARGLEGVGLGLAEGGLRGAIAGGIAPQSTGLAGYRDPNSAFSRANTQNQREVANLDQQLTTAQQQVKDRSQNIKDDVELANSYGTGAEQAEKQANPPEKGIDVQTFDSLVKQGNTPEQAYQKMQQEKGEPGREQNESLRRDQMAQTEQLRRDQMKQAAQFHNDTEADRAESRKQREADKAQQREKPTADEQKKADLVDNLNENLGVVEEIARRRPDLFGPVAGRWTELKNKIGTSDPDIAALEAAQHQLGMVQQGVHGMRSAHGIQGSVDSLMNGFHNTPEALLSSIKTARDSARTFTEDVGQKGQPGHGGVPEKSTGSKETRTYQGHDYEKGADGQWHRK